MSNSESDLVFKKKRKRETSFILLEFINRVISVFFIWEM